MTARQIEKKLEKAGIDWNDDQLQIERDEILVTMGYTEDEFGGHVDDEATAEMCKKIYEAIPEFNGGRSNMYGGVRMQIGFESRGDWMDKSSRHHY